jgi:sterol O-acyltransferase
LEFTRQLSTFDRQNLTFSSSEFHGFFVLFWMGVALMLLKVVANNWRIHGTIWGKNEIIRLMFANDVLVLGLTDLVLCWSTVFCLVVQRAVFKGYLRWSGSGWLIQNVGFIVYLQVLLC